MLGDANNNHILILEQEHSDVPGSMRNTVRRGLIASLEQCKDGDTIVKSLMVVSVTLKEPSDAVWWQVAYDHAIALQEEDFQSHGLADNGFSLIRALAKVALMDDTVAKMLDTAAWTVNKKYNKEAILAKMIAILFMGRFAKVEATFGPETKWCVD